MEQPVILIAEDEHIVGLDLSDTMTEAGYEVEGPYDDLHSAMLAFQKRRPDLAILDIRLHDTVVYPFAEKLIAEDVPVIFHSGHLPLAEVSDRFPDALALAKPCPPGDIITHVQLTLKPDGAQDAEEPVLAGRDIETA
jgi:two-component system, response regulator PdtaR